MIKMGSLIPVLILLLWSNLIDFVVVRGDKISGIDLELSSIEVRNEGNPILRSYVNEEQILSEPTIIFTTAFKDIGRENWSEFSRKNELYYFWFMNLAQNLPQQYPLVVFMENELIEGFLNTFPALSTQPNLYFYDFHSVHDTFFQKYLEIERAIITSPSYQEKIPLHRRNRNPEYRFAEYTLITHSKINFVRRTWELFPQFSYYAWVDFGWVRNLQYLPTPTLNWSKLSPNHIVCACIELPNIIQPVLKAEEMLGNDTVYFQGSHFIIPQQMVKPFEIAYEQKLLEWQSQNICDDEQNLFLQLYQDHPDWFWLYQCPWFQLFTQHLNIYPD